MTGRSIIATGFTLVELLIVAVVLAIFAAVVTTQMGDATLTAKESSLRAYLANARRGIDRYQAEHDGVYPGAVPAPSCTGNTFGQGVRSLEAQMVFYSNRSGGVCPQANAAYPFGPYVKWTGGSTPNPVTGDGQMIVVRTGNLNLTANRAGGGFMYDSTTGQFIANDTNRDSQGVPYESY